MTYEFKIVSQDGEQIAESDVEEVQMSGIGADVSGKFLVTKISYSTN